MIISKKINDAVNKQINHEIYSAYIYLAMAAWAESENLKGMAHWLRVQFREELGHAMKFFHYVNERGGRVVLQEIACPPKDWKNPAAAFEVVYEHECGVTARIYKIAELAEQEKDNATSSMLKWFIDEQVEEEANALEILTKLKMIKENIGGLMLLDRELGSRKDG